MNICCICAADGVLQARGQWYCMDHLEDGLLAVLDYIADQRGYDLDEIRKQVRKLLDD